MPKRPVVEKDEREPKQPYTNMPQKPRNKWKQRQLRFMAERDIHSTPTAGFNKRR